VFSTLLALEMLIPSSTRMKEMILIFSFEVKSERKKFRGVRKKLKTKEGQQTPWHTPNQGRSTDTVAHT
jgi:hypothetical protein